MENSFKSIINQTLMAMKTSGADMAGVLVPDGQHLLLILFSIVAAWSLLSMLVGDGDLAEVIGKLTKTFLITMFCSTLLVGWTSTSNGVGITSNISIASFFIDGIGGLADKFVGQDKELTDEVVTKFFNAIDHVNNVPSQNDSKIAKSILSGIGAWIGGNFALSAAQAAAPNDQSVGGLVADSLGAALISFLVDIVLILALVSFVFVLNAGMVMMLVGLAIGPILVPFMIFKPASFLFEGWLKLMISGGLYKVIASITALICLGSLDAMDKIGKAGTGSANDSATFIALLMLFFAWLAKELMGETRSIVSGLVGGNGIGIDHGPRLMMIVQKVGRGVGSFAGRGRQPTAKNDDKSTATQSRKPEFKNR